jgi:hypothetical protein
MALKVSGSPEAESSSEHPNFPSSSCQRNTSSEAALALRLLLNEEQTYNKMKNQNVKKKLNYLKKTKN